MGQLYYPTDVGKIYIHEQALTVTAGAYTALDILGGDFEIPNAAKITGGSGKVLGVTMSAEDDGSADWAANDVILWFFKSNPAGTYDDNAAFAITDADAAEVEFCVKLDTKYNGVNVTILQATGLVLPYTCDGTSLWCLAQNVSGRTPDATDALQLRIKMARD